MLERIFDEQEEQKRHERYIKEESIRKGKAEVVWRMYTKGLKYETIAEYTDFSVEQIKRIIRETEASQKRSAGD